LESRKEGDVIYFASKYGLMCKADFPLPSEYYHVFNQVDALVFNYNSFEKTKMDTVKYNLKESVAAVSDDEIKNKLKKITKKLKVDYETLSASTPRNAINHLTSLRLKQLGYGYRGIKYSFYDKAKKADMNIGFLMDKTEYQNHKNNIPKSIIDYYTKKAIEDYYDIKKWRLNYRKEWQNGITKNIEKYIDSLKINFLERYEYDYLYYTDKCYIGLQKYLNNDQTEFVLISMLQLLGVDGIFKRLEKEGYIIEQLK
jgi:uncharacterized protein YbaP (TraB family)